MTEFLARLLDLAHLLMITFIASAAKYSYSVLGGAAFKTSQFIGFMIVSFFAAFLAGEFLPASVSGRDGLIGLAAWGGVATIKFFEDKFFKGDKEQR